MSASPVRDGLVRIFAAYPVGVLARAAGKSKRTCEKWRLGKAIPGGDTLGEMTLRNDRIRRDVLNLILELRA